MKKSIITNNMDHCFICGSPYVEIHHCFYGTSNRKNSDKYGLVVPLCPMHHRGDYGVHHNPQADQVLKETAQRKFEETHTREEFMQIFGRNYLDL